MRTQKKTPIQELKDQFGNTQPIISFIEKIFSNHLTSDEFCEQDIFTRKDDVFTFSQVKQFLTDLDRD